MDDEYKLALTTMLDHAAYEEDVAALVHFVFHARFNGGSNVCLICSRGTDGEHAEAGHDEDCAYALAFERVRGERLADWVKTA